MKKATKHYDAINNMIIKLKKKIHEKQEAMSKVVIFLFHTFIVYKKNDLKISSDSVYILMLFKVFI